MVEKKQFFLIPLLPLGFIIICFGIFVVVRSIFHIYQFRLFNFSWIDLEPFVIGLIIILIGLSFFLFKGGFRFNDKDKIIIKFIEFAGLRLWTKQIVLPNMIDSVQIAKRKMTLAPMWAGLIPLKAKSIIFDVYLVHGHYFDRLFSVDEKQAIDYGQIIADSYNVKMIKNK